MVVIDRIFAFLLFIAVCLFAAPGFAGETYYVSLQGRDSNPGTQDAPWGSLQHAIDVAGPGDTVLMRGGTYETDEVWIRGDRGMGGADGQYLTIKNYPGELVSVGGDRRIIVDGANFMRIEGLHFRLPYNVSGGGEAFQVVNNTFNGPQPKFGAIEFFSDNGLVQGNVIQITGGGNTQDHGIYLHAGHNNIVRNNVISGMSGYGIHVYDAVASGGQWAAAGYNNITIEGNVITGSRERAGIIIYPDEIEAQNFKIQKNVIANNPINGIRIRGNTHDIEIYNNTFYNNGWGAANADDQSAISLRDQEIRNVVVKNNIIEMSQSGAFHIQNREQSEGVVAERNLYWGQGSPQLRNVTDPSALYGDALLKNPDNNDFQILQASPAIDAGVNVGLPFKGSAPDLGAIEFGEQATSVGETENQPSQFRLYQNYPNPFNPVTQIAYEVLTEGDISLSIYSLVGTRIRTLVEEKQGPGSYEVEWDGLDALGQPAASGIYFYRLTISGSSSSFATKIMKMILLN
jgi:parallel beta-helix repeat protein